MQNYPTPLYFAVTFGYHYTHDAVATRGGGGNSLYFVWYRRAAGIAPIFQVIYTSIGHGFISNIHL